MTDGSYLERVVLRDRRLTLDDESAIRTLLLRAQNPIRIEEINLDEEEGDPDEIVEAWTEYNP